MSKQELTRDTSNIGIPYKTVRIGLHDYILNLDPTITHDWSAEVFMNLSG